MLCDRLGIDSEYAVNRIKTIFLNGKPVDDMEKAYIRDGCSLALSAAMPGLVGAVMRRDGFFSPLREGITYREKAPGNHVHRGLITVKLFNLLIQKLGPRFFTKGFLVNRNDLPDDLAGILGNGQTGREIFIIDEFDNQ
jgi:hypothetical protein